MHLLKTLAGIGFASLMVSGCANTQPQVPNNMIVSGSDEFKLEMSKVDQARLRAGLARTSLVARCFSDGELPLVRKYTPNAWDAFVVYNATRIHISEEFDRSLDNYWRYIDQFYKDRAKFRAFIAATEPQFAQNDSGAAKEAKAAKIEETCADISWERNISCKRDLIKPIFMRNSSQPWAPIEEGYAQLIVKARAFDETGAPVALQAANQKYSAAIKEAKATFALEAQKSEQNILAFAKDESDRKSAEDIRALGDFIGKAALTVLDVAGTVAEVRAAQAQQRAASAPTITTVNCNGMGNMVNCVGVTR